VLKCKRRRSSEICSLSQIEIKEVILDNIAIVDLTSGFPGIIVDQKLSSLSIVLRIKVHWITNT